MTEEPQLRVEIIPGDSPDCPFPGGVTKQELAEAVRKTIAEIDRGQLYAHPRLASRTRHPLLNRRLDKDTIIDHKITELMQHVFDNIFRILVAGCHGKRRFLAQEAGKHGEPASEILHAVSRPQNGRQFSLSVTDLQGLMIDILMPSPFETEMYEYLRGRFNEILARQLKAPTLAQSMILYPAVEGSVRGVSSADIIKGTDETEETWRKSISKASGDYSPATRTAVFTPIRREATAVREWFLRFGTTYSAPTEGHS